MKRLGSVDALRLIAVLAVIVHHVTAIALRQGATPGLTFVNLLTRFDVPTLFIISGYLSASSTRPLWSRIKRLLIPYAAWVLVYAVFKTLVSGKVQLPHLLSLLDGGSFYFLLWFMPMLMYVTLLAALPRTQRQRLALLFALLCTWGGVVVLTLHQPVYPYFSSLRGFLAALPAFASMYVAAQWWGYTSYTPSSSASGVIALVLVVALGVPALLPSGPGMIVSSSRMLLAGLAGFALLATALGLKPGLLPSPLIRGLARGSLGIYMLHMIVLNVILRWVAVDGRLLWALGASLATTLGTAFIVALLGRFSAGRAFVH